MLFGPELMMEITNILNQAKIPSILWGTSLLDIYGLPTGDVVRACWCFLEECSTTKISASD